MSKRTEARKEKAWSKAQKEIYMKYAKTDSEGNGYLACSAWDVVHVVVSAYQELLGEVK